MRTFAQFLPLFRRHAGAMWLTLLLSLITLAAGVALLGTSGWFITAAAVTTAVLGFNLFVPSALVRAFSFVRILARYGERLVGHNATLKLLSDLRGWLFGALFQRLPLPPRSLRHGDLVSRLTADVDALDTAFLVAIGPLVGALLIGTAMTTLLGFLLPQAAVVYGPAMALAVLVVPALQIGLGRSAGQRSIAALADARIAVFDGLSGHADFTVMGTLGSAQQRLSDAADTLAGIRVRLAGLTAMAGAAVQVLAALALVGTLIFGIAAHEAGTLDPATFVGLLLAVLASFEASSVVVRSVGKATSAFAAAERLQALAQLDPPIIEPAAPIAWPTDVTVTLEDVHFAYDGGAPVLNGVTLSIAPGEHVAIAGPSGGGKSTLLKLLLRLADPTCGTVRIGGTDLRQLGSADIHAHLALLSQESPIFIDSIRNNLLIARADASDEMIWNALEQARLDNLVRALPEGIDTVVGEAGRTLSAGQGRRLCLARALLSNAPILLLDEPTEALDRPTEEAFFATLAEAARGHTVVMVTHSDLPEGTVDRVLKLRGGRLA